MILKSNTLIVASTSCLVILVTQKLNEHDNEFEINKMHEWKVK